MYNRDNLPLVDSRTPLANLDEWENDLLERYPDPAAINADKKESEFRNYDEPPRDTVKELLPAGLKGMAFAALTAAIVASLAGKANSISTIFSLDIYKKYFNKEASEKKMVLIGRWAVVISMLIAGIVTPALKSLDQAYQFIQEYVGFFSPGVLAIFLLGFFWKRTTPAAAMAGALLTIPVSTVLKFLPTWTSGVFPDYPFLDRMSITFIFIVLLMVAISLAKPKTQNDPPAIIVDTSMFRVSTGFMIGSVIILGILAALYTAFW